MTRRFIVTAVGDRGTIAARIRAALEQESVSWSVRLVDSYRRGPTTRYLALIDAPPTFAADLPRVLRRFHREGLRLSEDLRLLRHAHAPSFPIRRRRPPPPSFVSLGVSTGDGATLAIIDNDGVKAHETFGSRLECFDATVDGDPVPTSPGIVDGRGEGTAVASAAAGSGRCNGPASGAKILSFRAEHSWEMAKALRYIVKARGSDVRTVVTARYVEDEKYEILDADDTLEHAIEQLFAHGIVMFAAAGNRGGAGLEAMKMPAISPYVLAVGGYDDRTPVGASSSDRVNDESTRGPSSTYKPDFVCPWGWYEIAAADASRTDDYDWRDGTSFAAAHAAGIVTAWLGTGGLTLRAEDIFRVISAPNACVVLDDFAVNAQGHGALAAEVALQIASTYVVTARARPRASRRTPRRSR